MFLNDTCKNAMNITDFMESIKLTIADMENLGKVGYVDAGSKKRETESLVWPPHSREGRHIDAPQRLGIFKGYRLMPPTPSF